MPTICSLMMFNNVLLLVLLHCSTRNHVVHTAFTSKFEICETVCLLKKHKRHFWMVIMKIMEKVEVWKTTNIWTVRQWLWPGLWLVKQGLHVLHRRIRYGLLRSHYDINFVIRCVTVCVPAYFLCIYITMHQLCMHHRRWTSTKYNRNDYSPVHVCNRVYMVHSWISRMSETFCGTHPQLGFPSWKVRTDQNTPRT